MFFWNYSPPPNFADEHNEEDDIIDDPTSMRHNVDKRCTALQNHTNMMTGIQMAKRNVMILMGMDFTCPNQFACFKHIDALIDYCNEH